MADDDEDLWPPFYLSNRPDHRAGATRDRGRTPPARGRSLSRDEIVRTAIAVADAEGPDAISMRRIARELGAGVMSLYWHVSSKEELLDLMLDTIQGEMTATAATGDVGADLRTLALSQRATLYRHRWVMPFVGGRPPLGPRALRNVEGALGIFAGREVAGATPLTVLTTVITYVMGAVLREQQEQRGEQDRERIQQRLGLSEPEMQKVVDDYLGRVQESGRYPNLTAMMAAGIDPDAVETQDERFEFGLDCLLDGITARLC